MNQRNQAAGMFKRFENFLNRRRVEISRFKIDMFFGSMERSRGGSLWITLLELDNLIFCWAAAGQASFGFGYLVLPDWSQPPRHRIGMVLPLEN